METSKIETFKENVTVKKVDYRTGQRGDVFMLVHLKTTTKLKKHNINAMIFRDIENKRFLMKGTKLRVKVDEQLIPEIEEVLSQPVGELELPTNCTTCKGDLITVDGVIKCPNVYCSATSRGFLFKLFKYAYPELDQRLLKVYLDGYVYSQAQTKVDNPYEYFVMFSAISDHNTEGRLAHWNNFYKENGNILWHIDVMVQEYLKQTSFSAESFWDICNFPNLNEKELKALGAISPLEILDGTGKEKLKKLPARCKKVVEENLDFVLFLKGIYYKFGVKVWHQNQTLRKDYQL
jgi:hypothetical protein